MFISVWVSRPYEVEVSEGFQRVDEHHDHV